MNEKENSICPGDIFELSYYEVPIIRDKQCFKNTYDTLDDYQLGGNNDWYIETYSKYMKGGFAIQIRRANKTQDSFDYVLKDKFDRLYYEFWDEKNNKIDSGI